MLNTFRTSIFSLAVLGIAILASCNKQHKQVEHLFEQVESIVEQYPDSALRLLDSIQNPYELNKSQFAEYTLRLVQAKTKAQKNISTDTLIFRASDYYKKKNDKKNLALTLFYCGRVLQSQSKLEEAIKMYLDARTLSDETNDVYLSGLTEFYIGLLNYKQYLCKEARIHFKNAALKFSIANGKYKNVITAKTYTANSFLLEHSLDSALFYYREGLDIAKQKNDLKEEIILSQIMGVALLNNQNIHLSKEAIRHAMLLSSQAQYGDRLPEIYVSLSNVFQEENKIDSALYYTNLALQVSDDITLKAIILETMSELEESRGDYQKSLEFLQYYTDYADSIYSQKQDHNIIDVQKKYNFELIQNANRKLMIEKLWFLIGFCVAVLVITIISFSIYRKRAEEKEALLLAKQQIYQLREMIKTKDKKEDKNSKISRKLRTALLEQLDIFKKVSLLEGFLGDDTKISGKAVLQKVNKIIYKSNDELDRSAIFQSVNALYDDFLSRLSKAYPTLTEDEILICCLLKIGLNNEEIRLLLKSTPNIIQKKKTSIREKTGMKKQEHFIKQIDDLIGKEN